VEPDEGTPLRLDPYADAVLDAEERQAILRELAWRRWTQQDLADALRVSRALISKVLNRQRKARPLLRRQLLEVMGRPAAGRETPGQLRDRPDRRAIRTLGVPRPPGLADGEVGELIAPRVPVFRWGSGGDLRLVGTPDAAIPEHWRCPPEEVAELVAERGFAIQVRGNSLAGRRPHPILDGDYCW
jgi:hypothetical protein